MLTYNSISEVSNSLNELLFPHLRFFNDKPTQHFAMGRCIHSVVTLNEKISCRKISSFQLVQTELFICGAGSPWTTVSRNLLTQSIIRIGVQLVVIDIIKTAWMDSSTDPSIDAIGKLLVLLSSSKLFCTRPYCENGTCSSTMNQ